MAKSVIQLGSIPDFLRRNSLVSWHAQAPLSYKCVGSLSWQTAPLIGTLSTTDRYVECHPTLVCFIPIFGCLQFKIRKEALTGLGAVFRKYAITEDGSQVSGEDTLPLLWIQNRILQTYFQRLLDDK